MDGCGCGQLRDPQPQLPLHTVDPEFEFVIALHLLSRFIVMPVQVFGHGHRLGAPILVPATAI